MRSVTPGTMHRFHRLDVRTQVRRRLFTLAGTTLLLMVVMGVSTLLGVTYLQSRVQRLTAEMQRLQASIRARGKELENRRLEYERYNSPEYIFEAVKRFGLDLRQPEPGQVRRMPTRTITSAWEGPGPRTSDLSLLAHNR